MAGPIHPIRLILLASLCCASAVLFPQCTSCSAERQSCHRSKPCAACLEQCSGSHLAYDFARVHCASECALNASTGAHHIMEHLLVCLHAECAIFDSDTDNGEPTPPRAPILRRSIHSLGFDELQALLEASTPVILEDLDPLGAPDLSFMEPRNGRIHTVEPLPPAAALAVKESGVLPFASRLWWTPTTAWGGAIGQGAPRHVDEVCEHGFALGVAGFKRWRIHASAAGLLGVNVPGNLMHEGVVYPGELLLFAPWLPHETLLLRSDTVSVHGSVAAIGPAALAALKPPRCSRVEL